MDRKTFLGDWIENKIHARYGIDTQEGLCPEHFFRKVTVLCFSNTGKLA
jgi:hypothetical protein